ncbi:MAG: hypothetical protein ACTSVO_00735 [Candidatus Heimdallarchaeaceae archaeon]
MREEQKKLSDFTLFGKQKEDNAQLKEKQLKQLTPYKVIPIRLKGTNKTEKIDHSNKEHGRMQVTKGNCLDTVRGCPSYSNPEYPRCGWDCYSEEAVRRYKKEFGKPVSMQLKEQLLLKDLVQCKADWIRIGVDGAPSLDWEITIRCAELINLAGKIPVIITRMWRRIKIEQLQRLINIATIIHITVSATDENKHLARSMEIAKDIESLGGQVVLRVVTFAYKEGDEKWEKQEELMKSELPVLEQPARIMRITKNTCRKNSMWVKIEQSKYKYHKSYITGKENRRWLTAGRLYRREACETACPECENQCMVKKINGYGHVLGEENTTKRTGVMV